MTMSVHKMALLAADDFSEDLKHEIQLCAKSKQIQIAHEWGRLFLIESNQPLPTDWIWAQNIWFEPKIIEFESISEAAQILKNIQGFWSHHSIAQHRRAELIQEKLLKIKSKPLHFLQDFQFPNLGAWALLDKNKMIFSVKTSSPFPDGEMTFHEDKIHAPSRAYLKLWEFFTIHKKIPQKNSVCIDMGSCPGGWTWVLANMDCQVLSVDKAPIDERLLRNKKIKYISADAFKLDPKNFESELKIDWFFSDIICYPEKLLELIHKWKDSGRVKNFVCTIKFKGKTDFKTLAEFKKIPNSFITHLCHNKHEVTWVCLE